MFVHMDALASIFMFQTAARATASGKFQPFWLQIMASCARGTFMVEELCVRVFHSLHTLTFCEVSLCQRA
jgi:hypothetical protein